MVVEHKHEGGCEVAGEDIPITFESEVSLWNPLGQWTEKRVAAYPPEQWNCTTTLADEPGKGARPG